MPDKRVWNSTAKADLVSDWYPGIAEHVDDIAVFRSCWRWIESRGSVCQMNTGSILADVPRSAHGRLTVSVPPTRIYRPSWSSPMRRKYRRSQNWSSGSCPAAIKERSSATTRLRFPFGAAGTIGAQQQRSKLDLLAI